MKLNEFFELEELVDPDSFRDYGAQSLHLLDPVAVDMLYQFRKLINLPITVNNWNKGGQFRFSGFRPADCPIGAKGSQHKKGSAFDCKIKGMSPPVALEFIRKNAAKLYAAGLRRVEDVKITPTWLHIDSKEHGEKCIQVIDLTKVVERIKI